ncbi:hypothetical protein ACNOYE_02390 [Nannocystaceae bacterium ST9]
MNSRVPSHRGLVLALGLTSLLACSSDPSTDDEVGDGDGDATSGDGDGDGDGDATSGDGDGDGDATTGDGDGDLLGGKFRIGINHGHRNQSWGDAQDSELSRDAGCNSARLKLHEGHLDTWGWGIELEDMATYEQHGKRDMVAFLIGPTRPHSSAPADAADWELEYWAPTNLYEPTTIDGAINPDNYWGFYVFQTVMTYRDHVKIWEVWNEPDWVPDWPVTQTWLDSPPLAEQLPRFNADIYAYVRMLRVTREAALLADPEAKVALGGLGYETFLDAVVRYSDDPNGGAVGGEFPELGHAYFDVLNYHFYPHYSGVNSSGSARAFVAKCDAMQAVLESHGVAAKPCMATESGASHVAIEGVPSGPEYARHYAIKLMALAHAHGILGVDWFALSDGAALGESQDVYSYMGLVLDVAALASTADATQTDTGVALASYGQIFGEALADLGATTALNLPADVDGAAFRLPDDRRAWVLWAFDEDLDEAASASYELATEVDVLVHQWDWSQTGATQLRAPAAGVVTLDLTAAPQLVVEQP